MRYFSLPADDAGSDSDNSGEQILVITGAMTFLGLKTDFSSEFASGSNTVTLKAFPSEISISQGLLSLTTEQNSAMIGGNYSSSDSIESSTGGSNVGTSGLVVRMKKGSNSITIGGKLTTLGSSGSGLLTIDDNQFSTNLVVTIANNIRASVSLVADYTTKIEDATFKVTRVSFV